MRLGSGVVGLATALACCTVTGTAWAQDAAAPRLKVVVRSGLSDAFELTRVDVTVDGQAPISRADADVKGPEVVMLDGPSSAGAHAVNVELAYVGTGFGVFSYLKGYAFSLKAQHAVTLAAGDEGVLEVVTFEQGNATTEMKDRPAIRVDARVKNPAREQAAAAAQRASEDNKPVENSLRTADEALNERIRDLEARSAELQARIDRTRTRVGQLQDVVFSGNVNAGGARLVLRNEMGQSFRLREVQVSLDGANIRTQVDPTGEVFSGREEFDVFDGRMIPGVHNVNVLLVYQGVGSAVFAQLSEQQFRVRSSHAFVVEQGRRTTLRMVAYESGDASTDVKDRPTLRFEDSVDALPVPATGKQPAQ